MKFARGIPAFSSLLPWILLLLNLCLPVLGRIIIIPSLRLKDSGLEKPPDLTDIQAPPTINITAFISKDDADRSHVTDLVVGQFFPGRPFLESIIVQLCRDILEVFGGKEIYGIELFVFDFAVRKFIKYFLWFRHGVIVY